MKTKLLIHPEDLNNPECVKFFQDVVASLPVLENLCRKEVLSDKFDGWDYWKKIEGFDVHFYQEDQLSKREIIIYLDNGEYDTYCHLDIPDLKVCEADEILDIWAFAEDFTTKTSTFIQTRIKSIEAKIKVMFGQPTSIEQLSELNKLNNLQKRVDDLQEVINDI